MFKPSKRLTGGGFVPARNLIIKEGVLFVPPFVSKTQDGKYTTTEVRLIPFIDETGVEMDCLKPDPEPGSEATDNLSETFKAVEIARGVGLAKPTDMITTVTHFESTEQIVPGFWWTPYKELCERLRLKIEQELKKLRAGRTIDIPKTWLQWATSGKFAFQSLARPNGKSSEKTPQQFVVRCVALSVSGRPQKDTATGRNYVGPAVFMLPPSGAGAFLDSIFTKLDGNKSLSYSNNVFGDFASLASGQVIQLYHSSQDKNSGLRLLPTRLPLTKELVMAMNKPWDELIDVPSVEKSIKRIAEALDPMAVAYGLRADPNRKYSGKYESAVPEEWMAEAAKIALPIDPKMFEAEFGKAPATDKPETPEAGDTPAETPDGLEGIDGAVPDDSAGQPAIDTPNEAPPAPKQPAPPPEVARQRYEASLRAMESKLKNK